MSHSYDKVWIHAIWATKDRMPLISAAVETKLHEFMAEEFREIQCPAKIINGMADHVHCLFLLSPQRSISEIIKQIKGSSSHFVNQNDFIPQKFAWQIGYAAFSVSESGIENVVRYIENQKSHHQKKTFQQEYEEFLLNYGLGPSIRNG